MTRTIDRRDAPARYVEAFQAFAANGAGRAPAWLQARRQAAMQRFADLGFPTTREEAWRFTDVEPIVRTPFEFVTAAGAADVPEAAVAPHLLSQGPAAVFVNGEFAAPLSSLDSLPDGVTVGSLRAALEGNPELVEAHLGAHARDDRNPFTALSTAFLSDGALVHVPKDAVLTAPLQLVFLAVPVDGTPSVWHPRVLVVVDQGAQATVVESYVAMGGGGYWTNAVTEMVVGENAKLNAYRLQLEDAEAFHTAATHSWQARSSVYSCVTFTLGARLSRHDVTAVLDGDGADCTLDGLSLLRARQHTDAHTTLEHAQPNCTSWEYFNGVFDDRARGVFNGRIIVRPGAQKTDAKQTNNNLLLSGHARADSQPQLEIYADDVKCTHGATLGPIDDDHVFYLQSRGLSRAEARRMLSYGFASEILQAVSAEELRRRLDRMVTAWLARGSPVGV